jgi:DNA-directed RNA polymerase specialized sigma24 family protein
MAAKTAPQPQPIRLEAALSGLLTLAVARLEYDDVRLNRKVEVLLADAGLTYAEIASVTGKTADTVRKAVERARTAA